MTDESNTIPDRLSEPRDVPPVLDPDALRVLADKLEWPLDRSAAADAAVVQLRAWADELEHLENGDERCEGCSTWLAEDEGGSDNEGVRLCPVCIEPL